MDQNENILTIYPTVMAQVGNEGGSNQLNHNQDLSKSDTFRYYIFNNLNNFLPLLIAVVAVVLQFFVFKAVFPYANFIPDSYAYVDAARLNTPINWYPIGYSKFLRLFSVFSRSDTALVAFQYFFLEFSLLFFVSSIWYIFRPGKLVKYILLSIVVFNPIFLLLGNYVTSDAIFTALSIVWLTQLLWIIYSPRPVFIFIQVAILLILFTVRYNALFYPIVSSFAFILSPDRIWRKILGITISIVVVGAFVWQTSSLYLTASGTRQFSPFSGWQLANNALNVYKYTYKENFTRVPRNFLALDSMVREHYDTIKSISKAILQSPNAFYMWSPASPLLKYQKAYFKNDSTTDYFLQWAKMGPLYSDYGSWLIRTNPGSFAKRYLLPNAVSYLTPPAEFLGLYNERQDTVGELMSSWFAYKSNHIKAASKDIGFPSVYGPIGAVSNLAFFFGVIGFAMVKGFKGNSKAFLRSVLLVAGIWIIGAAFSIFSSPVVLRYQTFTIIYSLTFSILIIEYIYRSDRVKSF